jgi:hypothetical protein
MGGNILSYPDEKPNARRFDMPGRKAGGTIEKQKRNTETGDATHARAEQKPGGSAEALPHGAAEPVPDRR